MRALLALVALTCISMGNALGQIPPGPDSCGAEEALELRDMIACRRLAEEGRDRRCAAPRQSKLLPPTDGHRLLSFGDKTPHGLASKGVVFEAKGQVVAAPSAGRVVFAGAFRTFGNLVIIDSCNFDVIVAGMEALSTHAHALIEQGQAIGTISRPGSVVYVEVRRGNRSIDPFGLL